MLIQAHQAARAQSGATAKATPSKAARSFKFRGAALDLQSAAEQEIVISGPSETGKTIAALHKIHSTCLAYPGAQFVIIRKTYQSTVSSVVQSFIKKVLLPADNVMPFGGERPEWFDYPNGSRIWIGGMDNPNKTLSSERDGVLVNQAEELTLEDAEYLTTRTTGRAGNVPHPQIIYDCNPAGASHWLRQREVRFLESRHEDNPSLYDDEGNLTEQGERTLQTLSRLTGVRRERLLLGRWVNAEGTVYEFDAALHLVDRFDIPKDGRRIRVIDFGYTNPFVCQWWYIDGDGRMYLYREIYMTRRTVKIHAAEINRLSQGERIEATITDHDAEDRATLEENGIDTTAAIKDVSPGIQKVQERLIKAGDGKPRLFYLRDSLVERDEALVEARKPFCTEQEYDVYMWPKAQDGKPVKDAPIKMNDHGMDATRYGVTYADERIGVDWDTISGLGKVEEFKSRWQ